MGCGIQSLMTVRLMSQVTLSRHKQFSSFLFVVCLTFPDLKSDHRPLSGPRLLKVSARAPLIVVQLSSFQIEMREDSRDLQSINPDSEIAGIKTSQRRARHEIPTNMETEGKTLNLV